MPSSAVRSVTTVNGSADTKIPLGEGHGRSVVYALHDDHVGVLLAEAVSHVEHLRLGLTAHSSQRAFSA
jgi:hypothetical protein